MGLKITTGKLIRPVKTVIYGPEGIGKSTLASKFPDPLFLDTEGGTGQLDVRRVDVSDADWEILLGFIAEVADTAGLCKTLVIDTADWAEKICTAHVVGDKDGIESFGYGKGYTYLAEAWEDLLKACDKAIANGIHVVITAHAAMRKQELPNESGAFDRWEMKLTKKVAPLTKEWADLILFLNYQTMVVEDESTKSKKAMGAQRVMYASHHACWDAKNRYGLPDMMPMEFASIEGIFAGCETPLDTLKAKIADAGVTKEQFAAAVESKGKAEPGLSISDYTNSFINRFCLPHFEKIIEIIKEGGID